MRFLMKRVVMLKNIYHNYLFWRISERLPLSKKNERPCWTSQQELNPMLKIRCIILIVIQYFSDNGKNIVSHQISKYSFSERKTWIGVLRLVESFSEKKDLNRSSALGRKYFIFSVRWEYIELYQGCEFKQDLQFYGEINNFKINTAYYFLIIF